MASQAAIGFQCVCYGFQSTSEESQYEWHLHCIEKNKKAEKQNRELGITLINWVQD